MTTLFYNCTVLHNLEKVTIQDIGQLWKKYL